MVPLASGFAGDAGALPIRAEARVLGATLKSGDSVEYALGAKRHGYLVPAKGSVEVNGVRIDARDGAAITGESVLKIKAIDDAEIVLVDRLVKPLLPKTKARHDAKLYEQLEPQQEIEHCGDHGQNGGGDEIPALSSPCREQSTAGRST